MAFAGMLFLQIYQVLLVVERAFTKNSRKTGTCLFGAWLWKIIKALWLVKYSSLILLTEVGIVNVQGCGMHWCLSRLASSTKHTDTEPSAISNRFKSLQKSQWRSAFWFTYTDEQTIKYFLKFYFPQILVSTGFFDFIHESNVYKLCNRMYVTSFSFHSKLVLEKAKKPASYELAIHTVFSK